MARTKKRPATEQQPTQEPAVPIVAPVADDRTALDDLEARKGKKEKLPEGFKERLPGGVTRRIRVVKAEIPKSKGKPFRVQEPDGTETDYDQLEIEGPSRVRKIDEVVGCETRSGVAIETDAPVLVGNGRKVRK